MLCCVDMYVHSWRKNWKAVKTEFSINKFGFPKGIYPVFLWRAYIISPPISSCLSPVHGT
jgi:hypothetical protein